MFLYWLAILMLYAGELFAIQGGPELDRSLVSLYGQGQGELWGQYDYVDQSIAEAVGYGSTTSGLNYSKTASIGGKYGLTDSVNLRAQYGQYLDEVWRSTEPKITQTQYNGVAAVLQNIFYEGSAFDLSWSVGYRSHKASQGDIKRFQFGGYLVESNMRTLSVSDFASVAASGMTLTLSGTEHTLLPQGDEELLVDENYSVFQSRADGSFDVMIDGTLAEISRFDMHSLKVQSGASAVIVAPVTENLLSFTVNNFEAQIAPGPIENSDVIALPKNDINNLYFLPFSGAEKIFFQKSLEGEVLIYSSDNETFGDGDDEDVTTTFFGLASLVGVDGDDLSVLIDTYPTLSDIESSVGLLSTPQLASRITELNQLLSIVDTSYIVRAEPSDEAWFLGLSGAWYPSQELRFTLGSELRQVHVEPSFRLNPAITNLLTLYQQMGLDQQVVDDQGTTLGQSIQDRINEQLPQEKGWDENHLLLTVGADWDAYADLSFAAQYTFYTISRNGYQSAVGKVNKEVEDQTVNHQLDGWLFVKPTPDLTFYLHGRAYSNFLLGDRPLLYNARVNHKFTDPYGFVSAGVVWEF